MKFKTTILALILSLLSSSAVLSQNSDFNLIEKVKKLNQGKNYTYINNKILSLDSLTKYLNSITNVKHNRTSRFGKVTDLELVGIWGFKQDGDEAKVYYRQKVTFHNRPAQVEDESYHLIRLNSGYWFNLDRNRYVGYEK